MPVIDERGAFRKQAYVGQVRAANSSIITVPRLAKLNGTTRGLIACHGAGGTANTILDPAATQANLLMGKVLAARYIMISDDWSLNNWGNNQAVNDMAVASTLLETLGASTDPKLIWGGSMGALMSIRHAAKNPTLVAGLLLVIPALNLQEIRTAIPSARADQDTAWGITYPTVIPTQSAPNPSVDMLTLAGLIQCPVFLAYANNDTIVYAASAIAFASAVNANAYPAAVCTSVDLGATEHTALSIANAVTPMETWLSTTFPQDVR